MTDKKIKVVFLTYHLPLENEPGAFRPWMEAKLMAMAGFDVTVVTSGVHYMTGEDNRPGQGWCTEETEEGIRIFKTWAFAGHRKSLRRRILNYTSFSILAALVTLFKTGPIDRIFAGTDPIIMMPMVYLISRLKRAEMVLDERDLYPETLVALGVIKDGFLSRLLFCMQQFFRRKSRAILAATPGIRRRLLDYGCPPEKVNLLYNADVFLKQNGSNPFLPDLRKKTGKSFLVGYAGGLGLANDIPTLLRAAENLRGVPEIGFVIIGSGENRDSYIEYCDKNELTGVHFVPAVPRNHARQLLGQMDVCVHLYPAAELFAGALASKTLDYQGLGKPMIFCGKGDTSQLLKTSGGGVSLPSGDDYALSETIKYLQHNDSVRLQMGLSARKWFENNVGVTAASQLMKSVLNNVNSNEKSRLREEPA